MSEQREMEVHHDIVLQEYAVVVAGSYDDAPWIDGEVLFRGSLADCEAYIRLTDGGYLK